MSSGQGTITSNHVTLQTFNSTFHLTGETKGGPPTTYIWTRNGAEITRNNEVVGNGSYAISMTLISGKNQTERLNPRYSCTLTVLHDLPGVYVYTVSNRAMDSSVTNSTSIESKQYY